MNKTIRPVNTTAEHVDIKRFMRERRRLDSQPVTLKHRLRDVGAICVLLAYFTLQINGVIELISHLNALS